MNISTKSLYLSFLWAAINTFVAQFLPVLVQAIFSQEKCVTCQTFKRRFLIFFFSIFCHPSSPPMSQSREHCRWKCLYTKIKSSAFKCFTFKHVKWEKNIKLTQNWVMTYDYDYRSCWVGDKITSVKTPQTRLIFLTLKSILSIRWFYIAENPPTHSERNFCEKNNLPLYLCYPLRYL